MIAKLVKEIDENDQINLPNELCITRQNVNFSNFYKLFTSEDARMDMLTVGKNDAKIFLKYKRNNSDKQSNPGKDVGKQSNPGTEIIPK
jgi:hypothetical protein